MLVDPPIHIWFSLSYANYLVLPRTLLQSIPVEWQERFVACLEEADEAFSHTDTPTDYRVNAVDERGKYTKDPVPHYRRGRAYIETKPHQIKE